MPYPEVFTFKVGTINQPLSQAIDSPCLGVDPRSEGPCTVPPLFGKPASETALNYHRNSFDALGEVFCEVTAGRLLYPLKVTGGYDIDLLRPEGGRYCSSPHIIVGFGGHNELSGFVDPAKHTVDMEYWESCSLMSFLLDLRNGDYLTSQTICLQESPETEPIDLHTLWPILMQASHLMHWQVWNGAGCKDTPTRTARLLDKMCGVPNYTTPIATNPAQAVTWDIANWCADAVFEHFYKSVEIRKE